MVGKSPAPSSQRCTAIIAFVQQPPREEGFDSLIPSKILVSAAVIYQTWKPFCVVKTVTWREVCEGNVKVSLLRPPAGDHARVQQGSRQGRLCILSKVNAGEVVSTTGIIKINALFDKGHMGATVDSIYSRLQVLIKRPFITLLCPTVFYAGRHTHVLVHAPSQLSQSVTSLSYH